jgi:hypothetical protein
MLRIPALSDGEYEVNLGYKRDLVSKNFINILIKPNSTSY